MDRGSRIAQAALSLVGQDTESLVRPSDGAGAAAYYKSTSTCALAVLRAWGLAGCTEPAVTLGYYPERVGKAFADMIGTARMYGAWIDGLKSPPLGLLQGDAFVIAADAAGNDAHVGTAVADQAGGDISAALETVEGGQAAPGGGSSAIGRFTRHFVRDAATGLWMMGHRRLFGIIRAFSLPVPDDAAP